MDGQQGRYGRPNAPGNTSPDAYSASWQQSPPEDLRDWQKNTWYGAVPNHENPFDEPEDAPELREQRSENLNNHSGVFWDQHTEGYRFTGEARPAPSEEAGDRTGAKKKEGKRARPWRAILCTLAVMGALGAVLYFFVFQVREIRVSGNVTVSTEEVVRRSGLKKGTPMLSIRMEDVARGIENNAYLQFRYLEKEWPGTVVLAVKEREACCWMTWCGIFYTMDKQRVVLFETEEQNIRPSGLVRVDGLEIRSGCMVGQTVVLNSSEQEEVFSTLFLEMKVLNCTELIEEADLSNLNSLLLTTRDGFTVSLGDGSNLHAKLRSMLLTRDELLKMGYTGGIINVINLENPVYTPGE